MGIYEASIERSFRASHAIRLPDGSLEMAHEHLWAVTATFRSQRLDPTMGVVVDFLEAGAAMDAIMAELSGADLNQISEFGDTGPSAEKVARYVAQRLASRLAGRGTLYRLAVTEAPGCQAAYYP